MRSGELRHWVSFLKPVEVRDGFGGVVTSWVTDFSAWVSIEPKSGQEVLVEGVIRNEVTGTIRMRYLVGVNTKMRVKYNEQVYEILGAVNVGQRNLELELLVREVV